MKSYGKYISDMYVPKPNQAKVLEMEKLKERAINENKPKLQPKPILYNEKPWQEHMKQGVTKQNSQENLEEKPKMSEAHAKALNYLTH